MLFLVRSSPVNEQSGDMFIELNKDLFESVRVAKVKDTYRIIISTKHVNASEIHAEEQVARERVKQMLLAAGYEDDARLSSLVEKMQFSEL